MVGAPAELVDELAGALRRSAGRWRARAADVVCPTVGGVAYHLARDGSGDGELRYVFQGPCSQVPGHPPELCSVKWTAGGGRHGCGELGPHPVHRCCSCPATVVGEPRD